MRTNSPSPWRRLARVAGALAISSLAAGCFISRDVPPTVGVEALVASQYNHRGMVQTEEPVAQGFVRTTAATIDGGQLGFTAWGNMDLRNASGDSWFPGGNGGKFSEVDLTLFYSRSIEMFTFTGGTTVYVLPDGPVFPNGARGSTTELFAIAEANVAGFVPEFALHVDLDEADGYYATLGVSRRFPFAERFGLTVGAKLGYSDDDHSEWAYGLDEGGISDARATAEVDFAFDDRTTFFGGIGGSTVVDSDIDDWFDALDIDSDNIWLSGGVRFRF